MHFLLTFEYPSCELLLKQKSQSLTGKNCLEFSTKKKSKVSSLRKDFIYRFY